jgi:hypothetical protein
MQDRTSANSMKVLLQRTAGPYIWVKLDRVGESENLIFVRYAPNSDRPRVSYRIVGSAIRAYPPQLMITGAKALRRLLRR